MEFLGAQRAYEPAALALISFALSWGSIGIIQYVGRGQGGEANIAGAR
jgi:putative spermidine/putrescine transport system permease protein